MNKEHNAVPVNARRGGGAGTAIIVIVTFMMGAGGMYAVQNGMVERLLSPPGVTGPVKMDEPVSAPIVRAPVSITEVPITESDSVEQVNVTHLGVPPITTVTDSEVFPEADEAVMVVSVPAVPAIPERNAVDEAAALSPELAAAIERGRILKAGADAVSWGEQNLGYIGKAKPGDVIPGIDRPETRSDLWIIGDPEGEGSGTDIPRYESLIGPAMFDENGTLTINGRDVLLSGVMLPGEGSVCESGDGSSYDCEAWAAGGLREFIGGKTASCSLTVIGPNTYGACDVMLSDDGRAVDLASWMVSAGIALANDVPAPSLYWAQENEARERKAGLWEGRFEIGGRVSG